MKISKTFIWISAIAVAFWILLFIGLLKFKKIFAESVGTVVLNAWEKTDRIDAWCLVFKQSNSRWPKNADELQGFINCHKERPGLDLSLYKNLTFTETPKGTLKIHYDFYKSGEVDSKSYVTNGKYDEELDLNTAKK